MGEGGKAGAGGENETAGGDGDRWVLGHTVVFWVLSAAPGVTEEVALARSCWGCSLQAVFAAGNARARSVCVCVQ